jgi:predicted nucleic acid-binding protein
VIVVADTGPLLALAKIGSLDLLKQLYGQVFTAPAVYTEAITAGLDQGATDAPLLEAAYQRETLRVQRPTGAPLPISGLLHRGEAESIQLAIEQNADFLLMDDLDARRLAEANFQAAGASTDIKGTLGIIVSAYQQNLLTRQEAIDCVNALKSHPDIWISARLCDQVIRTLRHSV